MSQEQPTPKPSVASRRQIKIRVDQLKRAPGLSSLGVPELIGLAGALVLALLTLFAYFYFLAPARARTIAANEERARLQAQLQSSTLAFKEGTSAGDAAGKIKSSITDFESTRLAVGESGRMNLYTKINELIRDNRLRNTAGPSYVALPPLGTKSQAGATSGQSMAKWQTIYPGLAVSVTVEGPYQNIRHFIRDIETSREFLIVNTVELESITQRSGVDEMPAPAPPRTGVKPAPPPKPLSGSRTLVSLRVDMATYFRRMGILEVSN